MTTQRNSPSKTTSPSISSHEQTPHYKPFVCARAAIHKNAENLKIIDLSNLSGFTDFFLVCSGTSDRQVQAITDSVETEMGQIGFPLLSIEGYGEGRWVVMDFGDLVVHVFQDALREYYDLEGLWADAPRVPVPSEFYGPAASRLN